MTRSAPHRTRVIEGTLNPHKARTSPRFDTFTQEYLAWVRDNRTPETYRRVSSTIPRLVAFFGSQKFSVLTAWRIEQYKRDRKAAGVHPNPINLELAFLKAMLRKAQAWKQLAESPAQEVKPFKATGGKTRFLSDEEEATLLAACPPALRRVVAVGVLTGLRRQELAGLWPEDIDLDRRTLRVAEAVSKNGDSRTLPMGPQLTATLHDALAGRRDAQTVLVMDDGTPWTPGRITTTFGGPRNGPA